MTQKLRLNPINKLLNVLVVSFVIVVHSLGDNGGKEFTRSLSWEHLRVLVDWVGLKKGLLGVLLGSEVVCYCLIDRLSLIIS